MSPEGITLTSDLLGNKWLRLPSVRSGHKEVGKSVLEGDAELRGCMW